MYVHVENNDVHNVLHRYIFSCQMDDVCHR